MDITLIPDVMRRLTWLNGARLLDIWFSRGANSRPESGPPVTDTIRMDRWVLTFERARAVYDQLVSDRVWCNEAARREIERLLRAGGLLGPTATRFGDLSRPVSELDTGYVNYRTAGGWLDRLDDLKAALGLFVFRVVVKGTVTPEASAMPTMTQTRRPTRVTRHLVAIEQVGVYVRDSFDFNGEQNLGYWNSSGVSALPLPGYDAVGNADFRAWRARTGRGGDFLVFSDLKIVNRNPPDSFVVM